MQVPDDRQDAGCVEATCLVSPDGGDAPPDAGEDADGGEIDDGGTVEPLDGGHVDPEPILACELHTPATPFTPEVSWQYLPEAPYVHVMVTPVVLDVNADGAPDVVAVFYDQPLTGAVLRAVDGRTGTMLWQSTETDFEMSAHPAGGDLEGNGQLIIVSETRQGLVVGHSAATGQRLWVSHDLAGPLTFPGFYESGAPVLVNLDGVGPAEIVVGLRALDATGMLLWDYGKGAGSFTSLTVAADLDGDGLPEVTDGTLCVKGNGGACGWTNTGFGGFPAVGDLLDAQGLPGQDGKPELVVVNEGSLALVNAQTGAVKGLPRTLPSAMYGGPPTVADFDGDGQPEVGVATKNRYTVYQLRPGSAPIWDVLWSMPIQDNSSGSVGSSVFDFNQDGRAEVIVASETALHVFNGPDGMELMALPHCSGTLIEYAVVADVDADGHADIVVPENFHTSWCPPGTIAGLTVYRDKLGGWAPTRPIWNQHAYHVTNVCDGQDLVCGGPGAPGNTYGAIPLRQEPNWAFSNEPSDAGTAPPLNNFRQNNQTSRTAVRAPDLRPREVLVDTSTCPESVRLTVLVGNRGEVATKPGMKVAFYDVGSNSAIAVTNVPEPILPGTLVQVSATWRPPSGQTWPVQVIAVADDDGTGSETEIECDEGNNESAAASVSCTP